MNGNKYLDELEPYPLVSHEAWCLSSDEKVLKLDWNEATIPPSPSVLEDVSNFIKTGNLNWYPDVENTELISELAMYCEVPQDHVDYFASSDSLHEYIARSYINEGDSCIVCCPTYDNFRVPLQAAGAEIIFEEDFIRGNPARLKSLVGKEKISLVYICNPNNPTGYFVPTSIIEELVNANPGVLFVIDEAYYEFIGVSVSHLCSKYSNIIISRTFSKAFALASFRIGYAIASPEILKKIRKVRNAKNISALAQIAAISAIKSKDYTISYVSEVTEARNFLGKALNGMGLKVHPSSANFLFIECGSGKQKERILNFLRNNGIFVRNFSDIGTYKNCFRITVGTKLQMETVIATITAALYEG